MNIHNLLLFAAGWVVPGLGHVLQKKYWRGGIFFVSILAMTSIGLFMGGKIYGFQTENPLTILAFFADLGNGLIYLLARLARFGQGQMKDMLRITFEYGTAYLAGAGLLNFLIALDALDIARGKKK